MTSTFVVQMDFAYVCKEVSQAVLEVMDDLSRLDVPTFTSTAELEASQLLRWAEDNIAMEAQVRSSMSAALSSPKYLQAVQTACQRAFDSEPQLKRLATFQDLLQRDQGKLADRVSEALVEAKPVVDDVAKALMFQLLYCTPDMIFRTLQIRVSRCITKHVLEHVKTKPIVIPANFQFTEDDKTAQIRADLVRKLANLEHAADKISNIQRAFTDDHYGEEVLQSLLDAVEALKPVEAPASEAPPPLQPVNISSSAAALYDDLGSPRSTSSGHAASVHAHLEEVPASPVASDLSFVNVPGVTVNLVHKQFYTT